MVCIKTPQGADSDDTMAATRGDTMATTRGDTVGRPSVAALTKLSIPQETNH